MATSPTRPVSPAGNASTSVGASIPRKRALRSRSSASPVRRTLRRAGAGRWSGSPQARSKEPRRASATARRCRVLRDGSRMTVTRTDAEASGALDATLSRCKQLSLAAHGRLLVVLASANLGEDAVLLDLLVEPS